MSVKAVLGAKSSILFYTIGVLFTFVIVWTTFAEIDQVIRAEAVVEPSGKVQVVQARYSGKITDISVKVGQDVVAGQVLFAMDDGDIKSKIAQNTSVVESAEVELARLILESSGEPSWSVDPNIGSAITRLEQESVFKARQMERRSEDGLLRQQILRLKASIAESDARVVSAKRRLLLLDEERNIYAPLVAEGIEPRVRLLDIQGKQEDAENTILIEKLAIKSREIEIEEVEQRRIQSIRVFQSEAGQRAAEIRQRLEQAKAERDGLVDRLDSTHLTTPITGTVTAVYPPGVGTILSAGEPLADIVANSDSFLIKAKIQAKDISNVEPGQLARVSFTTYDFSKYGVLEAEVIQIAQNTTETDRGEIFYETWVRTSDVVFEKSGIKPRIIPGMIAQVDFLGEKRTVMEYIMAPILQTTSRALTEQ